jgi:hypothetical protein
LEAPAGAHGGLRHLGAGGAALAVDVPQDCDEGVDVAFGAVRAVKPTALGEEPSERAAAPVESTGAPIDVLQRAGPGHAGARRQPALEEGPVESGVEGAGDVRRVHDRGRHALVDALAAKVVVGEAGERDDHGVEGFARILAPGVGSIQLGDEAGGVEPESAHREFDDAMAFDVEPGGLEIERDAHESVGIAAGAARAR